MSNEELIQLYNVIVLTTYLVLSGYFLGTAMVVAALFKFRRISLVLGAMYGVVVFLTPYSPNAFLGLIIVLCYAGYGIHKLVKYLKARKNKD